MTSQDKFRSSDIEDFIKKPVSFSLHDDFFKEEISEKEKYMNLYNNIEPLVQPKKNTGSDSAAKISQKVTDVPKNKKTGKYSVFSDLLGKFRYEPAPEEKFSPVKNDIPQKQEQEIPASEEEKTKSIFGENRSDEDILYNYDVNRLFDIQREISALINAIQRLQSSKVNISRQEEELKIRAEKALRENERKKVIIDKLLDDINSIYEILKARSELVEQQEEVLLRQSPEPSFTYSPYIPESTSSRREPKWAEKPAVEKIIKDPPKSFSEKAEEKNTKDSFEINDIPSFGLNSASISAINSAINSLK